jgi:hypothetical protein
MTIDTYGVTEEDHKFYQQILDGEIENPTSEQMAEYGRIQMALNNDPGPCHTIFTAMPKETWRSLPYIMHGATGNEFVLRRKIDGKLFKAEFVEVAEDDVCWGKDRPADD